MLFLVVDEASVDRFLQLQTTGLCDSAPTSAHSILGRPVRGATPKYEKSMNESSPSSDTRSCSLVSSDNPEFREIECLLNDNHQKGKMMIMTMKTSGSQVDSPVAEGTRKEGGGRKIRDLHRDT